MQLRELVELFHLVFLGELGRQLDKQLYAVKGGCNLRFFYQSPRYSEDLDLDVETIAKGTLESKVTRLLHSRPLALVLQVHGLTVGRVSAPKQTETTRRWKIELESSAPVRLVRTKIEFSRRGLEPDAVFEPIDPLLVGRYRIARNRCTDPT